MYSAEELSRRKRAFAAAFLKTPLDPMAAALEADPRQNYAMVICNSWQFDAEVQAYMAEIADDEGAASGIPTKDEVARKLYQEATSIKDKDTALKYYDLLTKVMGFVEKASTNVNVNNTIDNRKVIMLPATARIDAWEDAAIEQQREITSVTG